MGEIHTVAVIGAGVAGRDIARAVLLAGYRTILQDILPSKLKKAEAELRGDSALLEYASTVEDAARQADLTIEAVPDELESKIEIFTLLDKICKPATILATITATLSVSEIASVTYRPEKCIGMTFMSPAHTMTTLELTRGAQTNDETVEACVEFGRKLVAANQQGIKISPRRHGIAEPQPKAKDHHGDTETRRLHGENDWGKQRQQQKQKPRSQDGER